MYLSEELHTLLDECQTKVEVLLKTRGSIDVFAIVIGLGDELVEVALEEGMADYAGNMGELLTKLVPMTKTGSIVASALCTPMPASVVGDGRNAVVIDLEHKDGSRVYAVLPYHKHDYLGWQFGTLELTRGKAQLFV